MKRLLTHPVLWAAVALGSLVGGGVIVDHSAPTTEYTAWAASPTPAPPDPTPDRPLIVIPSPISHPTICMDGSPSFSVHRQGTCSHHGGVSVWVNE